MTFDQAVDIGVRVETAITALQAAFSLSNGIEAAPEADILKALDHARKALMTCKREGGFR